MDNPQLVAIVIATVIAMLVKEFAVWVTRKTTSAARTLIGKLITKVIPILRKNWRQLFICLDIFMWIFSGFWVVWLVYFSTTPLTKTMAMGIAVHCSAWFYWMRQALRDWERYLAWKYPAA